MRDSTDNRLEVTRVKVLYGQIYTALIAHLVAGGVLTALLGRAGSTAVAVLWYGTLLIVVLSGILIHPGAAASGLGLRGQSSVPATGHTPPS